MTSSKVQLAFSAIAFIICFFVSPAEMIVALVPYCDSSCPGGLFPNVMACCEYYATMNGYINLGGACAANKAYCAYD
ncbi:unnamed protein product, partial [Mesorhabditis belari]|uniref:Uncharacterized protein n=1 Tax=Mesorhabditis belari TaxID=2138241 RepID=A0AAF3EMQ5_9BILA